MTKDGRNGRVFDSKHLLEIVFVGREKNRQNLISMETTAETKESGMKLKSGMKLRGATDARREGEWG